MFGLARIFKANPYHAKNGRFTNETNAATVTHMSDDMQKQYDWLSQRAKQLGHPDADTLAQVNPALFSALGGQWRRYHTFKGHFAEGFASVFKFNLNHEPAGSAIGGQFAKALSNVVADRLGTGVPVDVKVKDLSEVIGKMADRTDHPNIMPLHIEGTTLFGGDGLGITRDKMPQIPTKMRQQFLDGLHVQVELTKLNPLDLKPIQDQLDGMKVGSLYKAIKAGTFAPEPIIVSQDNYIIDGHHHWGAKVVQRMEDPSATIEAYKVHMQHGPLLAAAEKFTDENGIARKDITKADNFAHIFKFNPNHEPGGSSKGGQFAKASGKAGATNGTGVTSVTDVKDRSLAEYYAAHDKNVTEKDVLGKLSKADAAEVRHNTAKANSLPQTAVDNMKNGAYTPERQALHASIIDKYANEAAIKAATPEAGQKPTFIVLGGRGGSGKGAFTNGKINEFDASKFIHVDADKIKEMLPEYKGWNAAQTHVESGDIEKALMSVLLARGVNIISDRTIRSASGTQAEVQHAIANGYNVEGHYMYLSREDAATRAMGRYLGDGPKDRGRLVPPSVILGNTQNETNFDALKQYFTKWSAYDNTGSKPVRIGHGEKA